MRKYFVLFLFILFDLGLSAQTNNINICEISDSESLNLAKKVFKEFQNGHSDLFYKHASTELKKSLSREQLNSVFSSFEAQCGSYLKSENWFVASFNNQWLITSCLVFQNIEIKLEMTIGKDSIIYGLYFKPLAKKKNKLISDDVSYREEKAIIKTGKFSMDALMCYPSHRELFPCVILIPGSGPADMNETIYSNTPFLDIAHFLAKQGIASLRFNKRTFQCGSEMDPNKITLNEEYVEDVLSAIELLKKNSNIDGKRIYLVGHSLGGMILPRILSKTSDVKGAVFMAANSSRLEDIILKQVLCLNSFPNDKVVELRSQVENVKKIIDGDFDPKVGTPLNLPFSYWKDLGLYKPIKMLNKVSIPMLFVNGGRDYQVPVEELLEWKRNLKNKENVSFKIYPTLSHIFMEGSEKPGPNDYIKKSVVSKDFLNDLSDWIKKN